MNYRIKKVQDESSACDGVFDVYWIVQEKIGWFKWKTLEVFESSSKAEAYLFDLKYPGLRI